MTTASSDNVYVNSSDHVYTPSWSEMSEIWQDMNKFKIYFGTWDVEFSGVIRWDLSDRSLKYRKLFWTRYSKGDIKLPFSAL